MVELVACTETGSSQLAPRASAPSASQSSAPLAAQETASFVDDECDFDWRAAR